MELVEADVAIVGAGPVGSVAARFLSLEGIRTVLVEAGMEPAVDLRASTIHPPTLQMLDQIGLTQDLLKTGLKAPLYKFRERRTGETISFDMSEIRDLTLYPFRLQCEQFHLSRLITGQLEHDESAELLFGHRALAFDQDADGVTLYTEGPTAITKLRSRFLIGADGANSVIRKWLGTGFDGFTYPEKFLCYTTKLPLEESINGLCHVNYVSDPEEWMVLLRVPSMWRVLVPADPQDKDEVLLADQKKNEVFERLIGDGDQAETVHRTIYRVHQRVAKSFRDKRVLIIGDAAHLNNPIGGFGLNSGIHDAFNLCEKLASILKNDAEADPLLDRFERQRRKTTHDFIQAQTIRNLEYLADGKAAAHDHRKRALAELAADPEKRRDYMVRQAMIECLEQEKDIA